MNFNHYELYLKLFTWKIKDSISDYQYPEYFYPVNHTKPYACSGLRGILNNDRRQKASSASLS